MAATRNFVALSSVVCMAQYDNKFVLPALPIAENLRICVDVIEHYALHARVKKRRMAALIMMNGSWTLVPLLISLLLSLTLSL